MLNLQLVVNRIARYFDLFCLLS